MKPNTLSLFAFGILSYFVTTLKVEAVIPSPDGGYPGGNTAEGQNALFNLTTGTYNTAIGYLSLGSNTTNSFNTAVGAGTLLTNAADQNTAMGAGALLNNTSGNGNTANGAFALASNQTAGDNTAVGAGALVNNVFGDRNTAVGAGTLTNAAFAGSNIAIGYHAGNGLTTGCCNIDIGSPGVADEDHTTRIGQVQTRAFMAGIHGVNEGGTGILPVYINGNDQLGTVSSSRRFKKEIKPMEKSSETLLSLKPVTFHYKNDETNRPEFGLIAEEVAQVNPALVVRDKNGEIYTVRYDAVNAMLLNEFLKDHRKNEEQEATIAQQRKDFESAIARQQREIEALTATVKQQAAQIQKVSAQLELNKPAPQTVLNDH